MIITLLFIHKPTAILTMNPINIYDFEQEVFYVETDPNSPN